MRALSITLRDLERQDLRAETFGLDTFRPKTTTFLIIIIIIIIIIKPIYIAP